VLTPKARASPWLLLFLRSRGGVRL
jgi:hypothetical protein